jgi:hypothetical protein
LADFTDGTHGRRYSGVNASRCYAASAFKLAKIRALEIFRHMNRWMDTIGHSTVMQPGNSLLDNGITL